MRQSWTDDRLDDLKDNVSEFRAETKAEFAAVRTEMRDEFAAVRTEMRDGFGGVRAELRDVNARFDRLQQTMIASSGLIVAALVGLIATQL